MDTSVLTRRALLRFAPMIPIVSVLVSRGFSYHAYSAASKVGPWAGWITNRAGQVVAFVKRSGALSWMRRDGGFWDKW